MALLPRPVRNNNPLDIRVGALWLGLMPVEQMTPEQKAEGNFAVFKNPVWGFRAALVLLRNYGRKYGDRTLEAIVSRLAPPSKNNTASYISAMEHWTGLSATGLLDMEDFGVLSVLVRAFARQEAGDFEPYWSDSQIDTAVAMLQGAEAEV